MIVNYVTEHGTRVRMIVSAVVRNVHTLPNVARRQGRETARRREVMIILAMLTVMAVMAVVAVLVPVFVLQHSGGLAVFIRPH